MLDSKVTLRGGQGKSAELEFRFLAALKRTTLDDPSFSNLTTASIKPGVGFQDLNRKKITKYGKKRSHLPRRLGARTSSPRLKVPILRNFSVRFQIPDQALTAPIILFFLLFPTSRTVTVYTGKLVVNLFIW